MDFIVDVPVSQGLRVVLVVEDFFIKASISVPRTKLPTALQTTCIILQHVFHCHGLTNSVVTDQEAQLTAWFWRQLMGLLGLHLLFSSQYHL